MAGASAAVRISCMNKVRRDAGDTALRLQHSGMRARKGPHQQPLVSLYQGQSVNVTLLAQVSVLVRQ